VRDTHRRRDGYVRRRGAAGRRAQPLRQPVRQRDGGPVAGFVDGVDGVGDEEPLVELEGLGGEGQEEVEELAGLEDGEVVVDAVPLAGEDGGDGGLQFEVDCGPERREMDGGGG